MVTGQAPVASINKKQYAQNGIYPGTSGMLVTIVRMDFSSLVFFLSGILE